MAAWSWVLVAAAGSIVLGLWLKHRNNLGGERTSRSVADGPTKHWSANGVPEQLESVFTDRVKRLASDEGVELQLSEMSDDHGWHTARLTMRNLSDESIEYHGSENVVVIRTALQEGEKWRDCDPFEPRFLAGTNLSCAPGRCANGQGSFLLMPHESVTKKVDLGCVFGRVMVGIDVRGARGDESNDSVFVAWGERRLWSKPFDIVR